jgi:hypothetical protein
MENNSAAARGGIQNIKDENVDPDKARREGIGQSFTDEMLKGNQQDHSTQWGWG